MSVNLASTEILIVDDVASLRLYLKDVLTPLGVTVYEADNGDKALELVSQKEFALILMDIEMPGKNGLEVTSEIRHKLGFKFVPVVIMTGLKSPELIRDAFEAGATDYISKPLTEIEILSRIRSILSRRQLSRDLDSARKAAETANQYKSEFISRLAHELKTPLNAINGFAQLIQSVSKEDDIVSFSNEIINAAKFQQGLIEEVTNLARIEAGIIDINLSDVDLAHIIKEAFGLTMPMAEKFQVQLKMPRRSDVSYTIKADDKRLKQVLLNLISNAIKYNKPNGEVSLLAQSMPGGKLRLGVKDTGDGIPEDKIPQLFEAFNRLGAEHTNIEGSGIGLPIARKMVELMGGHLEVESKPGQGSTFWVELNRH